MLNVFNIPQVNPQWVNPGEMSFQLFILEAKVTKTVLLL